MMKPKLINILVAVIGINIFGVIVFYGWVLSNHLRRSKLIAHFPETGDMNIVTVNHGGASHLVFEAEGTNENTSLHSFGVSSKPVIHPDGRKFELEGHTLKPLNHKPPGVENIPPIPSFSENDYVIPLDESVMKTFQRYPEKTATETVVILTPIHDVENRLKTVFLPLLQSLSYPHYLVSVAFGEDSSHDSTLHAAEAIAVELRKSFASVEVFHFNLTGQVEGTWSNIHSKQNQYHRRRHLAQARNYLLQAGLRNQTWTLWIDSDISFFPSDIIQQLLSAEKDIVTPLCIYMDQGRKRVFDKNTWRETVFSRGYQQNLPQDVLVVEGYEDTKRLWLSDLRAEGRVVPIDGVGGCTLLVKSQCHKNGVIFPDNIYHHHIETEGLSKLAIDKGYGVYGMPFVEVVH